MKTRNGLHFGAGRFVFLSESAQ